MTSREVYEKFRDELEKMSIDYKYEQKEYYVYAYNRKKKIWKVCKTKEVMLPFPWGWSYTVDEDDEKDWVIVAEPVCRYGYFEGIEVDEVYLRDINDGSIHNEWWCV